jgi:hypothetical protein
MKRWMTGAFWADSIERGVRTAAQAALGMVGAEAIGLLDVAWPVVGSAAGLAAVLSLLTSVAAGGGGDPETAGFVTRKQ